MSAIIYLREREKELRKKVSDECSEVVLSGFAFATATLLRHHSEVTPQFVRRVEMLEVLLFSFVEHCLSPEMLDEISESIERVRVSKGISKCSS